ncbi:MAG: caspase family protein [Chloroflexi bacterium]|nr:caspase family protein [Chloroflexota bacterium]
MSAIFEHGYALIIGVDANQMPRLALPSVAKDVQAIYDVLAHPQRCAYNPENVRLIKGEKATSKEILDGLYWLQEKVRGDGEATAVLYFSGHGMVDKAADQYYLIPYDIRELSRLRADAIKAETFTAEISDIRAQRMLVVLDCCHAAGMDVKNVDLAALDTSRFQTAAFPLDLPETKSVPVFAAEPGAKNISDLLDGEGRAILNSSNNAQSSFVRNDGAMSLFTYHLIEALTGHAPHPDDATVVYVTDVMSWVTHQVKKSAREQGRDQTPVMKTSGVFPIAMLLGGQGVAKGIGQLPPNPLEPLPTPAGATVNQAGGNIVSGAAGGDMAGGDINKTTIKKKGGVHIEGGFSGGSYVGGDSTVIQGDQITGGEKFTGSKISIGSVSGNNNAIGDNPQVSSYIQQGMNSDELTQLFNSFMGQVAQSDPTAVAKVVALQAEVTRGEEADDEKIADLIGDIAEAAPSAVEGLSNLFAYAEVAKAAGTTTQFILRRISR